MTRRTNEEIVSLAATEIDEEERMQSKLQCSQVGRIAMKCGDPRVITVKAAVKRLNRAANTNHNITALTKLLGGLKFGWNVVVRVFVRRNPTGCGRAMFPARKTTCSARTTTEPTILSTMPVAVAACIPKFSAGHSHVVVGLSRFSRTQAPRRPVEVSNNGSA